MLGLRVQDNSANGQRQDPALDSIEIANIRYAHSGRKPDRTRLPHLGRVRREVTGYRGRGENWKDVTCRVSLLL